MAAGVAIIVGGAACVRDDLRAAFRLCEAANVMPEILITNDMIARYDGAHHAVTLHPRKLPDWLAARAAAQLMPPREVWGNHSHRMVTKVVKDWGGSVGLFAVKIALNELGMRAVLCGVPMTVEGGHFLRSQPWRDALIFRRIWLLRKAEFANQVRSMSGWTAETLGLPTLTFLRGTDAAPV